MSQSPSEPREPLGSQPTLTDAPWLSAPETQAVLGALEAAGFVSRCVGGAVRNALMGLAVKDIDIATVARPESVIAIAEAAGMKTVPTGLSHGTVTVIAGHTGFEVTTLRTDIATDGRHASVAFTDDWAADAGRRDFTINALYCDAKGLLFDPLGGFDDLKARRVRFIGDARLRIEEDYLRILRFFRFTADYGDGPPDAVGLQACRDLRDGMKRLSAERVRAEMLRLLSTPRASELFAVMSDAGILAVILPESVDVRRLATLTGLDGALGREPDAVLRLCALAAASPGQSAPLRDRLRLSNSEAERMAAAALAARALARSPGSDADDRVTLYRHGAETYRDGLMLAAACAGGPVDVERLSKRLSLPDRWPQPALPYRGQDIIDAGLLAGPAVGRILSEFEDWWIAEGFPSERHVIAHALSRLVKRERGE